MKRIVVVPERLRRASERLRGEAEVLRREARRLDASQRYLDWETRYRIGLEQAVAQMVARAGDLANRADHMARYLATKAQQFDDADHLGATGIANIGGLWTKWKTQFDATVKAEGWEKAARIDSGLSKLAVVADKLDFYKDFAALPGALFVGLALKKGVVTATGPKWLRELAGLGSDFTEIGSKAVPGITLIPRRMSQVMGALSLLDVVPEWVQDVRDYRHAGRAKLGAALLVDGWLKGLLSAASKGGGAYLGGAVAIGVLGLSAPAGIVAAGAAGAIGLGWVGDQAYDWLKQSGYRDQWIDWTARQIAPDPGGVRVGAGEIYTKSVPGVADRMIIRRQDLDRKLLPSAEFGL